MLKAGSRVGPYELLEPLGSGGFGVVWHARSASHPDAAVKVLHKDLLYDDAQPMTGPSVVERFLAEARIIQQLDHPGLVEIYDVVEDAQTNVMAYAMERLTGFDLTQLGNDLDLETVLDLYGEIADTLAFLHANDVIHRDVKPQNVFVCEPEPGKTHLCRVKLLDFGAAKELHTHSRISQTGTGVLVGTVRSMAPESFRDVPATPAMDQWGLGVSLYESLTGAHPFEAAILMAIVVKIETTEPPPMKLKPAFGLASTPASLEAVVARALAKNPEDRFESIHDMAKALRAAAAELRPRSRSTDADETVFDTHGTGGAITSLLPPSVRLAQVVMQKTSEEPPARQSGPTLPEPVAEPTLIRSPSAGALTPTAVRDASTARTTPQSFDDLDNMATEGEALWFPKHRPSSVKESGFSDDTATTRTDTPLPHTPGPSQLSSMAGEVSAPMYVDGSAIRQTQRMNHERLRDLHPEEGTAKTADIDTDPASKRTLEIPSQSRASAPPQTATDVSVSHRASSSRASPFPIPGATDTTLPDPDPSPTATTLPDPKHNAPENHLPLADIGDSFDTPVPSTASVDNHPFEFPETTQPTRAALYRHPAFWLLIALATLAVGVSLGWVLNST